MPATLRSRSISAVPPSDPLASPAVPSLSTSRGEHGIEVPDPDFHDFDSSRTEEDMKPGQIWAIYDDKDGMPRYYGRINSVSLSPFKVQFWWLVCDERSSDALSTMWTRSSGYYVSTGEFENGEDTSEKTINIFSHRMYVKEQFVREGPSRMKIYPRKGDVWAMYKDWDEVPLIRRSEAPHVCKFDMVEVLVDYSKENGVKTAKLAKVRSLNTVFQRQDGPQDVLIWRTPDLLRFSHSVPAVKIRPNKLLGIPKQALELDPAAIPDGYTEPENGSGNLQGKAQPVGHPKMNSKQVVGNSKSQSSSRQKRPMLDLVVRRFARCHGDVDSLVPETGDSGTEAEEVEQRPMPQEHLSLPVGPIVNSTSHFSSKLNALKCPEIGSESDFYDFNSLRTETDIKAEQIWAISDAVDQMPRIYVRVVRVLESPFQVEVCRLKLHPSSEQVQSRMDRSGLSMSCGRFKNDNSEVMGLECFSHLVLDRAKDRVKIYPRQGEVWAMFRNWDLEDGGRQGDILGTFHINGYNLVEVLADFQVEGTLEIVRLAKVVGFKSLFQRQGKPIVKRNVGPDLLFGFSHSIPSRRMYKDDTHRIPFGAMEIDPSCIPNSSRRSD